MTKLPADPFGARSQLGEHIIFRLDALEKRGLAAGSTCHFRFAYCWKGYCATATATSCRQQMWNAWQPGTLRNQPRTSCHLCRRA